jgi:hypothetical protein
MALADLFRRNKKRLDLDLGPVKARFTEMVPRLAGRKVPQDLVRARLADHCRDVGLEPVLPDDFAGWSSGLDDEGWRRLALAGSALDVAEVKGAFSTLRGERAVGSFLDDAFISPARELTLLTMELLQQSPLRVEEFTRQFLVRLGAGVKGETDAVSVQQLARLDYARLLEQAEKAKVSAEERMEYIRKLQQEQEARRPRRGKW